MTGKDDIKTQIIQQGLLPLYYHDSAEVSFNILKALYKAGVRIIEFTNRGENALDNFLFLQKAVKSEMTDMKIGIGTITSQTDAEIFIAAGAHFIVCPIMDNSVAACANKKDLLWIPGCMTPTEINAARDNGASLVKIFPANILGPAYISSIKEIFRDLLFIPTGGVEMNKDNIQSWFDAGVAAVGIGSRLFTKSILSNHDYDSLTDDCADLLMIVKDAKQHKK